MTAIPEGTTSYVTVSFYDRNGDLEAPGTISYRVDDVTTGNQIRGDTAFTPPAGQIEITLTPDDNAMVNSARQSEVHRVTVVATYAIDDEVTGDYDITIRNLRFHS